MGTGLEFDPRTRSSEPILFVGSGPNAAALRQALVERGYDVRGDGRLSADDSPSDTSHSAVVVFDDHTSPDLPSILARLHRAHPTAEVIVVGSRAAQLTKVVEETGAFCALNDRISAAELSAVVARAVDYSRLRVAASRRDVLMELSNISVALLHGQTEQDILHTISNVLGEGGFDRLRLYLLSPDERSLVGRAHVGMTHDFLGFERPIADDPYMLELLHRPQAHVVRRQFGRPVPFEELLGKQDVEEWACAPLVLQGKVIGKLSADNKFTRQPIREAAVERIALLAAMATLVVEKRRLLDDVEQRARSTEALLRILEAVNSTLDRDEILKITCASAVELLAVDHSALVLFNPELDYGLVQAEFPSLGLTGLEVPLDVPAEQKLIQTGNPVIISDVASDPSLGMVADPMIACGIASAVFVPIVNRGEIFGSFSLDALGARREFSLREVELCQVFAAQVAPAIARANRLSRLAGAITHVMGQLDATALDDRLSQIARYATEILNAEACGVFLTSPDGRLLRLEASHGHREGGFEKGREFVITDAPGHGMTGWIAARRTLFNECGEALRNHVAVRDGTAQRHTPSGRCDSLLAVPLQKVIDGTRRLIGLIRVDNKHPPRLNPPQPTRFDREDEWSLTIFADAAVAAVESGRLVDYLQRLVASSPTAIIAVDAKGRVREFNPKAEEILGYGRDAVRGTWVGRLYKDEQVARSIGDQLRDAPDGRLRDLETWVKTAGGRDVPIRLSATRIDDNAAQSVGSVGYFEDLRVVRQQEQRLRLLLTASRIVVDADRLDSGLQTLADLLIEYLPHTFCRILLHDASAGKLIVTAASGVNGVDWNRSIGARISPAAWTGWHEVESADEPVVRCAADSPATAENLRKLADALGIKAGIHALLVAPLKTSGRLIGVLDVGESSDAVEHVFTPDECALVSGIAASITALIDRLQQLRLAERRRDLLGSLDDKLKELDPSRPPHEIRQEIVRLATQLVDCAGGAMLLYDPRNATAEILAIEGFPAPEQLRYVGRGEPLIDEVRVTLGPAFRAITGTPLFPDQKLSGAIAVPFGTGNYIDHLLYLAHEAPGRLFNATDAEVLERFSARASIVVQQAQLIRWQSDLARRNSVLRRIAQVMADLANEHDVLHALATTVTAGWGFGFNRAAVFLLNESGHWEARLAIGHLEDDAQRTDWLNHNRDGHEDPERYIAMLRGGTLRTTPLADALRDLVIPLAESNSFARVLSVPNSENILIVDHVDVPERFAAVIRPETPLVLVPLIVDERPIGLVVADNKFSKADPAPLPGLSLVAQVAAVHIDNLRNPMPMPAVSGTDLEEVLRAPQLPPGATTVQDVLRHIVVQARMVLHSNSAIAWVINWRTGGFLSERAYSDGAKERKILPNEFVQRLMAEGGAVVSDLDDAPGSIVDADIRDRLSREDIASFHAVPLESGDERLGLLCLNYQYRGCPTDQQRGLVQAFAMQAAEAIRSAQLIEQLDSIQRSAERLARLATVGVGMQIADEIASSTRMALGCDAVTLYVYDHENKILHHPPACDGLRKSEGVRMTDGVPKDSVVYRVLQRKHLWPIEAVREHKDFKNSRFVLDEDIISCIAIPLRTFGKAVGAMFVNYRRPYRLTAEKRQSIELFANQAAIVIDTIQLQASLQRTEGLARTHYFVALAGLVPSAWKHSVAGRLQQVEEAIDRDLTFGGERTSRTRSHLQAAKDLVRKILDDTRPSLPSDPSKLEDRLTVFRLNEWLRQRFANYKEFGNIELDRLEFGFSSDTTAAVDQARLPINEAWLREVCHLIESNAINAMGRPESKDRRGRLDVRTKAENGSIAIYFADTGPGIPPGLMPLLFHYPIPDSDNKRVHIGAMLAQMVTRHFTGEIAVSKSDTDGATVAVRFPLSHEPNGPHPAERR